MKIGVVGCGALGSFYGAKLGYSGQEVHFLLRSDYEAVRRKGVLIKSPDGDLRFNPKCAKSPEEIGVCDLVIVGLKTTANDQFGKLLTSLVGSSTAILTLQNGLGNEAQLAKLFGEERILGGLCFVCLNRTEAGVIQHMAHGAVVMGEYNRWPEPRTHDIASMFRNAGVVCKVSDNLEAAHWEKLVWNIPFNGLGVAGSAGFDAVMSGHLEPGSRLGTCPTTDVLLADARWEAVVRELMSEVISTANAKGLKVSPDTAEKQIARTRNMGAYKASTLIDFERGQPLELDSLFFEPLRQAHEAGVSTPILAKLCRVLAALNPQ